MFRGATKVTLDDKGRVVVPAQHRDQLASPAAGRVVVTVDRDQCLRIYPFPEWERIETQLNAMPSLHPQARRLQRLMIGHAQEMTLDSHGRLALTPELREYAGLDRAAFLVGQGRGLELWDEARWKLQRDEWTKSEQGVTELAAELSGLQL
ncbi:MAG TPA: division/cell wall cluster transcriptional repressor MraZ [Steroidobacteraceae bacterium]|nr:division/cell wall cluster transcriptional repressor MraZ [Steroidobacteraceae bacterium]